MHCSFRDRQDDVSAGLRVEERLHQRYGCRCRVLRKFDEPPRVRRLDGLVAQRRRNALVCARNPAYDSRNRAGRLSRDRGTATQWKSGSIESKISARDRHWKSGRCAPYLTEGSAFIVRLRIGGGTRIKILAFPWFLTTGAERLQVRPGHRIMLADELATFARAVVGLLQNPAAAHQMAEATHAVVTESYDSSVIARQFAEICRKAMLKRKASSS